MAIPEVDKSLTKALREIPEKGKSENGRINKPITSKYEAILTFPLFGDLLQKTVLSTVCQLLKQADALKLRTLGGEEPF
jgi:hypothetical protein